MKTLIVIPARMASTRFPNKPMALIDGLPMIQRVWQQAMASNIGEVVVACCEKEVFDLINSLSFLEHLRKHFEEYQLYQIASFFFSLFFVYQVV